MGVRVRFNGDLMGLELGIGVMGWSESGTKVGDWL